MGIYLINFIDDFSSSSSATMPSLAKNRFIVPEDENNDYNFETLRLETMYSISVLLKSQRQ